MSSLLGMIAFFSFIALVLGLIKPSLVVRWGDEASRTRKKAFKTYLLVLIIAVVGAGITASPDSASTKQPVENSSSSSTEGKKTAENSSSSNSTETKKAEEKPVAWNTSEIDAGKNGNIKVAVKELKKIDDIKSAAETQPGAIVVKRPWDYYGKVLTFTGQVSDISDYAPNSDEAKALGGKSFVIVINTEDGTTVQGEIQGDSGTIKKGEKATIYGYPAGTIEGPNTMGGKGTYLLLVGKQ